MSGPVGLETTRRALSVIPAEDRDLWVRMAFAVKSEHGEEGFGVWDEWSRSAVNYQEKAARDVWKSAKGGSVTIGTLLYEAKQRGFNLNGEAARIDQSEVERYRAERASAQLKQAEQDKRAQERASKLAEEIYKAAKPATDDHPYLKRKGIAAAPGVRVGQWFQVDEQGKRYREKAGCLLIPMRDSFGRLWNLQAIFTEMDAELERDKDYLAGGRKQGTYFAIGSPDGALAIGEGYATMQSVRAATGLAVCVAFDRGNLLPAAKAMRDKFKTARLILAADNDIKPGKPNYGLEKATEAARAVGAVVAVPDLEGRKADFNDLAREKGSDAVKASILAAGGQQAVPAKSADHASEIIYQRLSEIQAKPIKWLWQGRIARGKLTMIGGHPGLGKSQVTNSIAAVVTTGGRWPVDRSQCEPGSVLILSAEDDAADTIRPRLEAAGADVNRVHVLQAVRDGYRPNGEEVVRPFNLRGDIRQLEQAVSEIGDVVLIVIDPVSAYLGGTDSHNNADIRALLAPLSEMAGRTGAAVVAVTHLNKGGGGEALLRFTGSLAFVAASRAAFIVAKDPENEARRFFLPAKNNIAPDTSGLAFGIEPTVLPGGIETSRIAWEGQPVTDRTADDLLRPPEAPEERSALEEAADFLRSMLAEGAMPARRVLSEGREAGHSEKTLRRAVKTAGVDIYKDGMQGGWLWRLAPKMAKDAEDAHAKRLTIFGQVGHLREGREAADPPADPASEPADEERF